jgi:polyhydroxyalkanoate synthesis repressor PhaR
MRKAVIKKYENRRLYDTAASRYVNLDEVARMVREGIEVQVLDARTSKDITRVILTQIIMEDAKGTEHSLPLDLLRQLIIASDRVTHDFLAWYFSTVTEMYQKAQSTFFEKPRELVRSLFNPPSPPADVQEVEALRRRVQELEQRLAQAAPPRRKPRKKIISG